MKHENIIEKKDKRIEKTKKALRESLFELLQQREINDLTVTELTNLAHINRSTFYLYYNDLYDMLEKIQDEIYDEFILNLKAVKTDGITENDFAELCLICLQYCQNNLSLCKFILNNDVNSRLLLRVKNAVRSVVPDSAKFYPQTDARYYLTDYCLTAIINVILIWMNDGMKIHAESMASFFAAVYMKGSIELRKEPLLKNNSIFKK